MILCVELGGWIDKRSHASSLSSSSTQENEYEEAQRQCKKHATLLEEKIEARKRCYAQLKEEKEKFELCMKELREKTLGEDEREKEARRLFNEYEVGI